MVAWWWLIVAALGGAAVGVFYASLCAAARDPKIMIQAAHEPAVMIQKIGTGE